ncbi:MAG: hypothetical protein IPN13_17220 [Bacteroidetes bacterium]|nr:hypothetical protein [Bacteroidota bacterium]
MEEVEPVSNINLFNGHLETGVRAVIILEAVFPKSYDLTHLTWFDHLVVHTQDIDGPSLAYIQTHLKGQVNL